MRLLFSGAFIALSSVASVVAAESDSEKKNVLFIAVDDMKPLLGCYGDQTAQTPVMGQTCITRCFVYQRILSAGCFRTVTCKSSYRNVSGQYKGLGFEDIDTFQES